MLKTLELNEMWRVNYSTDEVRRNNPKASSHSAVKSAIRIEPEESANRYTPIANKAQTPDADHNETAATRRDKPARTKRCDK
jgi:hypothetical protein